MVMLQGVLTPDEVARVRDGLSAAPFQDGRRTAGATAAKVKANTQADGRDPGVQALERFVHQRLAAHPVFAAAVRPKLVSRLLFSRYREGDGYGAHTDDALMGDPAAPLRTDVAFTLFLSEPGAYEGGALVVTGPAGAQAIKLAPGDAVAYPAGSIHYVETVGAGERLACVGWAQSVIRDPVQRELMFELSTARASLADADREALLRLDKTLSGLLRLWAEP